MSVKIMTVFGTRPEAIKMAPVIKELKSRGISTVTCVTGQHRDMLDQMLSIFDIKADHDLNIMATNQTISHITSKALLGLEEILKSEKPNMILVQGDTTTALAGALAAFYQKVPVGHIEAGLRTDDKYNPYPEEMNRRLITQIGDLHFAPTERAKNNLLNENIDHRAIEMTGNTVIDALLWVAEQDFPFENQDLQEVDFKNRRCIIVTSHRRENLGDKMQNIFKSVKKIAQDFPDTQIIFPVHLNPAVQADAHSILGDVKNVLLLKPLSYSDLVKAIKLSYLVMTDSGGIQEEAPAFGKPVLVLRDNTERPEGIEAGTAALVGTDPEQIYNTAKRLLTDPSEYAKMSNAVNPYGDGHAASKIVDRILADK